MSYGRVRTALRTAMSGMPMAECGPLQNMLAATPGDGRQIMLAGRQDLQMVVVAANPDDLFDAIVVRFEFFVGQRPVFFHALR